MAYLGNSIRVAIRLQDEDSDQAMHWLGGETSNNFNLTAEAVEVSDKRDIWAKYIAGKLGSTFEATVYADKDNPPQVEILSLLAAGTPVEFLVGQFTDPEGEGYHGIGIITAVSDTNDFGAVASRTVSVTVTDEVDPDYLEAEVIDD